MLNDTDSQLINLIRQILASDLETSQNPGSQNYGKPSHQQTPNSNTNADIHQAADVAGALLANRLAQVPAGKRLAALKEALALVMAPPGHRNTGFPCPHITDSLFNQPHNHTWDQLGPNSRQFVMSHGKSHGHDGSNGGCIIDYDAGSNGSAEEFSDTAAVYTYWYLQVSTWLAAVLLIVCILGIFFNLCTVWIFTRPAMKAPINVLLTALSVVDATLLLLAVPAFVLPGLNVQLGLTILDYSIKYTTLYLYPITLATQTCSIWIMVLITVCHPIEARARQSTRRMSICVLVTALVSLLYNVIRFWEYRPDTEDPLSVQYWLRMEPAYFVAYYTTLYLITHFAVPFTALIVLNGFVARAIWRARSQRRQLTRQEQGEHSTSVMMIVVTAMFAVCNSLTMIINLVEAFDTDVFIRASSPTRRRGISERQPPLPLTKLLEQREDTMTQNVRVDSAANGHNRRGQSMKERMRRMGLIREASVDSARAPANNSRIHQLRSPYADLMADSERKKYRAAPGSCQTTALLGSKRQTSEHFDDVQFERRDGNGAAEAVHNGCMRSSSKSGTQNGRHHVVINEPEMF